MMTSEELLAAWEQGTALPVTDRAASLIGILDPATDVDDLTVGQCDAVLFELRGHLFGDRLDVIATCAACGDQIDMELQRSAIAPPVTEVARELTLAIDGHSLELRILRNADFRALAGLGSDVTPRDVVARCLVSATGPDGGPVTVSALPEEVVDTALEALAEADPGAHVLLDISCPCGAGWTDQIDIRDVLWSEVELWVTELLHDVHALASAYGWRESDVVRLSPWRRDWYRRAVGW